MDALIAWAKENYNLISLLVGIIGIIIGFISLFHELNTRKRKKADLKNKIATKEAQLKAMEESMRYGIECSAASHLRVETAALRAEIDELKSQL